MGQRGRAPKPTALRIVEGDQKCRINTNEPSVRADHPIPPDELSDAARKVWHEILKELSYMRIASPSDGHALACYCEAVVMHRKVSKELEHSPLLLTGREGNLVKNPLIAIQRDAATTVKAFAQQFGLTPASRSGIRVPEATDDERERLLS